jgi:elongation factor 1-gamma
VEHAKSDTLTLLHKLDDYLLTRTYLVGEKISLADVSVACNLLLAFQHVLEPSVRKPFMNVTRWFETLINQPEFKAVLGQVTLCDKPAHFDNAKFKEVHGATGDESTSGKKDKGEKEKGDKKDKEKHKEEKSSKKKEATETKEAPEEMDETELALAEESKKKDPFDAFPKGTFNLDEFKRVYSNEDTVTKAIPYFWDHFDKENWSMWYCEYKYPKELTLVFMSCNLITGMYQRLDKMRKNAFGSMVLLGTDNDSTISGLWFWRGQDLAFTLSDDWQIDYESYSWKKLDFNAPETKKLVQEYFTWEGDFGGKKVNQGKIFK